MIEIKFYRTRDPYGYMSNFSPHPVLMDNDITYPTAEHAFQAMKFLDPKIREQIRNCKTPGDAAAMGRDRSLPLREDWETIKDAVMLKAVYRKFQLNHGIKDDLLKTGHAKLIEHTTNDAYWGDGGDGSGLNMLGRTLMYVRSILREDDFDKIY